VIDKFNMTLEWTCMGWLVIKVAWFWHDKWLYIDCWKHDDWVG